MEKATDVKRSFIMVEYSIGKDSYTRRSHADLPENSRAFRLFYMRYYYSGNSENKLQINGNLLSLSPYNYVLSEIASKLITEVTLKLRPPAILQQTDSVSFNM
jgi:hypothetical protein